jgi:hypothetical protein
MKPLSTRHKLFSAEVMYDLVSPARGFGMWTELVKLSGVRGISLENKLGEQV